MFGSLFEEDGSPGRVDHVLRNGKTNENGKKAIPSKPPPSRSNTNMCGIENQGATCYLNSLLQTLLLTPEFRDGLFNLSREELGWSDSSDVNTSKRKLRVIPVELQKLFSQLLLADVKAVSTTELTESFGWVENEELQQHDVQELNRILFSAIEKSLVGTSGMDLISRLYRGTVVNQVECLKCNFVSEREESFFDLTISVSGHNALEGSLKSTYLIPEKMIGSNRYFCSHCSELVDADKRTKLRRLPPILTLSLLRFSYNPTKGERFKDTSKFSFPIRLDLTPFCDSSDADSSGNGEDMPCSNVYKLFSVVVHKGNAHGGHYHAYVRDVSCLGQWNLSGQGDKVNGSCVNGENEALDQPKSEDTSVVKEKEDKELPVPATLLRDILQRGNYIAPSGTMSLVDLCSKLSELTCGSTWKDTFQSEYGRLSHFLSLHPSLFYFNKVTRTVGLQPPGAKALTPSRASGGGADGGGGYKGGAHRRKKRKKKRGGGWVSRKPKGGAGGGCDGGRRKASVGLASKWRDHVGSVAGGEEDMDEEEGCESDDGDKYEDCSVSDGEEMLPEGTHWFDFDDATVKAIPASALESQYSGRESAYMLFYRREELGSGRRKGPLLPEHLARMVEEKNKQLRKEREVYDMAVHQVYVRVLPSGSYTIRNSALHKRISVASESVEELRVPVDERWTLSLLHEEIAKACEKEPGWNADGKCLWPELYTCMDTPCGLHLLEPLKNLRDPQFTLVKDVYDEDFRVFAWDGKQVGGTPYNAGVDNEPLMLKLVMPSINGISHEISCGFPKSWPLSRLRKVVSEMGALPLLGFYLSYEPPPDPDSHKYNLRRGAVGNRSNSQKLVNGSTKTESVNGEEESNEFTLVKAINLPLLVNDKSLASLSIMSGGKILVKTKGIFSSSHSPSDGSGIVVWVEDWTQVGAKPSPLKRVYKNCGSDSVAMKEQEINATKWDVSGRVVRIEASFDTTVAQLKALAIKQLDLHPSKYRLRKMENEVVNGAHDSLCNSSVGLKCPLREELLLKDAKVESGSKIILEEGQAVEENQMWLTFSLPAGDGDTPREYEVIADKTCSVRELLRKMISIAQLTGEEWHIRKTRWNGDPGQPLDDPDSTVSEESLVHGDHLNLCCRSLPLRGYLRLNIYLCSRVTDLKNDSPSSDGIVHKQNGVLKHEYSAICGSNGWKLIPQQFHQPPVLETASHKLQDLGCLEIDQESSLYQLKSAIMELCPAISSLGLSSPNLLRLRLLRKADGSPKTLDNEPEKMRLWRVLRNSWVHLHGGKSGRKLSESDVPSLTSLQLHSGSTVAVQVLPAEEELRPDDVVLELCHRSSTPDSLVSTEFIWNCSVYSMKDKKLCNGGDVFEESISSNMVNGSCENGEVPSGMSSETPSIPCNSAPLSPPSPAPVQDENKPGQEENENSELGPLSAFKSAISSKLDLHHSNIILARYLSNKREWFVFHGACQDEIQSSPGRPKKKSSNKSPSSAKTTHHCLSNLSDGDIVAVKNAECLKETEEPNDFQFFNDFLSKEFVEKESVNGKKRRSVQNNVQEQGCKNKDDSWDDSSKRSERGIHIRVGDYS
ncbi:ubiquitin carboxyl-terminal hydrolase 40-like [Ischnura elegans]|uniref:ubiquitin carboxyl-terminal hydrolase 40-like n=1 Tax=Ischnura elegans TaxID=197161 RepID=UPI001ED86D09|nr:ubiquitin carboxyl-terminal hydrolase 40-like [Ischnura elegans]